MSVIDKAKNLLGMGIGEDEEPPEPPESSGSDEEDQPE
jgi:hypothetical protein